MNLKPRDQEHAWRSLVSQAEKLPQGLILVGPAGVGKRRTVKALFQWINCTGDKSVEYGACGECSSCIKITNDRHTDWIELTPKGDTIAVDDLREMKKGLYYPPIEAKQRFVVIDHAHKLGISSANTLLKTLEEPPAHTRFFLITHERGLLLPTIISRCQFIHFEPLSRDTLKELLNEMGIDIPMRLLPICLDLMQGGLEKAKFLSDEKTKDFLESTLALLTKANNTPWSQIVTFAEQLATGGSEEAKLELFLDILVRNAHQAAQGELAWQKASTALKAAELKRKLERHANRKLIALSAANLGLGEVFRE